MTELLQNPISPTLVIRELTDRDRLSWDHWVRTSKTGCFMQSWAWADFKILEGYDSIRLGLFMDHELVGGCIFYVYPQDQQVTLLFSPGGPLLSETTVLTGMPLLIQQAEYLARQYKAIGWRIEPLLTEKPEYLASFVRAPVDLLPSETLLIDLQGTDSERLAAMKPKGRYNLSLSQRYGVISRFTQDPQSIAVFYDLFWQTVERQEFFGEPYGFFINLCQTLFAADMAEIGLAEYEGEILVALLMVYWGDRATYLYGGRSAKHPEVMAPYHLHWAAMQRAKQKGCKTYDFYGFTEQVDHSYAKFSRFKGQFGGVAVKTIGAQDYFFYDQLADTLIHLFNHFLGDRP